jgi:uncharacterized membrane protein YcaP (DUF421 family)
MSSQLLDIVLRSAVVYLVVVLGLRLLGKKHVAQLSIVDLVLILLISNAVQNAMVGENSTLLGGIVAAATLLVLNALLTYLLYRSPAADRLFEGTPTLLVHNGFVIHDHLSREMITEEELERVVREHGIASLRDVKIAVMEVDGTVSVVPREGHDRRIENFKHRRSKFQPRKQ